MSRRPHAPPTADVDSALPDDVGRWIAHWAALQPDALAWADAERRCSYREAADRIDRLATWLAAQGVGRGDRVALWLGNRGAVLEAIFACAALGAIALPINARLTAVEVAFQLTDAAPRVLLVERAWRERAEAALAETKTPAPLCLEVGRAGGSAPYPTGLDAYEAALASVPPAPPKRSPGPEDPMILMYTSGTTGLPKGALLPHRKTRFNCLNARIAFAIRRDDRVLVVAPLFHSLGLQILALPALACGAGLVIQEGFDPERVWRAIDAEGISYLGAVPTAHRRLLEVLEARADELPPRDPSASRRLRFFFTAGAAAPAELIRDYHRHGLALIQGYGQTETSLLTCLAADRALAKAGSVGQPLPHAEIRLVDPETIEGPVEGWRDVLPGNVGELVVRGPITMLGYWQRPEATRETLRGEWLRTGDLATRDADFDVTLVGRAREMYISGGENVYPAEIEAVLTAHPDIEEAAVVAIPDAKWGEVGRAHVVPKPGRDLDLAALENWLGSRLARFKQPREIVIADALPRTASGKVQKHRLPTPAPRAER
jgi:fatty-acyl-CoA synthase